jgi:hypothetical protein
MGMYIVADSLYFVNGQLSRSKAIIMVMRASNTQKRSLRGKGFRNQVDSDSFINSEFRRNVFNLTGRV